MSISVGNFISQNFWSRLNVKQSSKVKKSILKAGRSRVILYRLFDLALNAEHVPDSLVTNCDFSEPN